MLNPINHARTDAGVQRYKVEPYVVAGDVYAEPPHVGRGGWTWYTGSAGWMYRAGLESILGFRLRGTRLLIDPCIPRAWPGFELVFRYRSARYEIAVENPREVSRGVVAVEVDGIGLAATEVSRSGTTASPTAFTSRWADVGRVADVSLDPVEDPPARILALHPWARLNRLGHPLGGSGGILRGERAPAQRDGRRRQMGLDAVAGQDPSPLVVELQPPLHCGHP